LTGLNQQHRILSDTN